MSGGRIRVADPQALFPVQLRLLPDEVHLRLEPLRIQEVPNLFSRKKVRRVRFGGFQLGLHRCTLIPLMQ